MEKKMLKLETVVARLSNESPRQEVSRPLHYEGRDNSPPCENVVDNDHDGSVRPDNPRTNHRNIVMDLDSGPGAIPGFYIADSPPENPSLYEDFISRNVISLEKAQEYFDKYRNRLDYFPYRILGDHNPLSLDLVRRASPLLTAAVCAVGALHSASEDYTSCHREFIALSAKQNFSKINTIDDVRALCIGAFWLSDLSWTLSAAAVRIATELQLHKSIFKAIQGDRQHYLRTRLYLLVYACDHHFSVAYGRPPMTRECEAVRNVRKFLECEHATEDDARLASQVLRWSICSNIFDTFGVDVDRPLSDAEVPELRRFSIALDSLRAEWADRFSPSAHVGNYPRKGVGLQYHFAKLYLCSHAFRGAGLPLVKPRCHDVAMELDEIANAAFLAALAILRAVVSDPEIQTYLDGLPTYFDTMIAFAAVFLLKVSTKYSALLQLDAREIRRLVGSLVETLRRITSAMHPRHLLVSITKGISLLLQRCDPDAHNPSSAATTIGQVQASPGSNIFEQNPDYAAIESFDPYFLGEYDFLFCQDLNFTENGPQADFSITE